MPKFNPLKKLRSQNTRREEIKTKITKHLKEIPKDRILTPNEIQILIYDLVNSGISPKNLFEHFYKELRHYAIFAYDIENPKQIAINIRNICRFLVYHYKLKKPLLSGMIFDI